MRKTIKFLFLIQIICLAVSVVVACSDNSLSAPKKLAVNDANVLSWAKVENAKSYAISVSDPVSGEVLNEFTSRKTSYSLSRLAEGDYLVKVKAVADGKIYFDSDWTEGLSWHRPYDSGCTYSLIKNDTEYEITGGKAASGSIRIEDTYNGKPVTAIADGAFKGNGRIEEIVILGKNITSIGDNAFYNCPKLTKITIPESVTHIGASAFQSCRALTDINIPENVTSIEKSAFAYCRALEKITIGDNVVSIGELAFSDCSALTALNIPDGVKTVGDSAFSGCKAITSVTFGSGIESLGSYAFYRCDLLESVTFNGSKDLVEIGQYAFSDCPVLSSVTLAEGLLSIGNACFYNDAALMEISIPESVSHVGVAAFMSTGFYDAAIEEKQNFIYADNWLVRYALYQGDEQEETIKITPDTFKTGVVGIADEVFQNVRNIQSIQFPASLRHVGNYAFYCSKLPADATINYRSRLLTLRISDYTVRTIGDYAFAGNDMLNDVELGAGDASGERGLVSIGTYAFYDCARVDNKIVGGEVDSTFIPDSVNRIGTYAFKNTKMWNGAVNDENGNGIVYAGNWIVGCVKEVGSITFTLDAEHTSGIADYAFYKCSTLQSVTNLNAVNIIGRGAFYGCSGLAAASLNRNLKKIEDYTFYKCSNLTRVSLPRTLNSIGRSAFYKCLALNSIDLSLCQVKEIKPYAFYGCTVMQNIDFGEHLETIGDYAFYSNTKVEALTLPDTVEYLGVESFGKNGKLASLDLGKGVKVIDDYAFYGCKHLTSIVIPDSVQTIGNYAFYNCKRATEIVFGSGVKSIGDYAFYEIAKMRTLYIPDNVESIGSYAFKGGKYLISVVLPGDLAVGQHAFFGANDVTFYTDAGSLPGEWHKRWNSSYRFVVWDVELSEDNSYVVSLTVSDNTVTNVHAKGEISEPVRKGYTFVGWAISADSTTADYAANAIMNVPVGTKLYAVWKQGEPEYEEIPDDGEDDDDDDLGTLII